MKKKLILLGCCTMYFFSFSSNITIYNVTNTPLSVAFYRTSIFNEKMVRCSDISSIDSFESILVDRPGGASNSSRYLVAAHNEAQLSTNVYKHDASLYTIGVGYSFGTRIYTTFYLAEKKGAITWYDPVSFKVSGIKQGLLENIEKAYSAYRESIAKHSTLVTDSKYKDTVAHVRKGTGLCTEEKAYLATRTPITKQALERFLEVPLDDNQVPTIAVINSGGGIRSLISCTGFHAGLQKIGLLDAVTYDVGLSGGSWFLALWMLSGHDIETFKSMVMPLLQQKLSIANAGEAKLFAEALLVRFALRQPVTLVNAWGALLANSYLESCGDKRHQLLWSSVADYVQDAHVPFPILSVTSGHMAETEHNRPRVPWYEFTPFEARCVSDYLGDYSIPMWAFGRKYHNGLSIDYAPELDVGGLMGICGSAFAFSFARGYDKKIKDLPVIGALSQFFLSKIDEETVGKKRISVGKVNNFTRGISGLSTSKDKHLKMVDGGIAFNLPYPPVSGHGQRKADIYIFCDASSNVEKKGPENLRMITEYAKVHGLNFPPIDVKRLAQKSISIFKDTNDSSVPLVFYIPRSVAEDITYPQEVPHGFTTNFKTTKFAYTEKEFLLLSLVTETNIVANKDRIKEEILSYIYRKYSN